MKTTTGAARTAADGRSMARPQAARRAVGARFPSIQNKVAPMRPSPSGSGPAIAILVLIALPAWAGKDCDAPAESWQPRSAVHALAQRNGWQVEKLKIDDGCYEIKGRDADGRRLKAKLDPATLEVVDLKREDGGRLRERERERERESERERERAGPRAPAAPPTPASASRTQSFDTAAEPHSVRAAAHQESVR
jgi:hypothetical protein